MDMAFEIANKGFKNDEVPVGAVIVKNDVVIATAYNMKEKKQCCIDHAEMIAIQKATNKLNNWRLDGCDIYVTLDPCPMCASAIKQSRIKNVYSALNNQDKNNIKIISLIFKADKNNSFVHFESNIDCVRGKLLLQNFFLNIRNK